MGKTASKKPAPNQKMRINLSFGEAVKKITKAADKKVKAKSKKK
jgi:hypothetical protein